MFFALGVLATVGALGMVARGLKNAPEGYEDEHGFHVVKKRPRAAPAALLAKTLVKAQIGAWPNGNPDVRHRTSGVSPNSLSTRVA